VTRANHSKVTGVCRYTHDGLAHRDRSMRFSSLDHSPNNPSMTVRHMPGRYAWDLWAKSRDVDVIESDRPQTRLYIIASRFPLRFHGLFRYTSICEKKFFFLRGGLALLSRVPLWIFNIPITDNLVRYFRISFFQFL
jgi:hypothetical protein